MKHAPKPLVEEHYHIQDLIDAQEKRTNDREYHRNVAKERDERVNEINASKDLEIKPFWCVKCKEDFVSITHKQVDGWSDSAFYKTKHKPCGTWCMRLITDTWRDAYWTKSKKVAQDRGQHFEDTVQPYQTGFNLLYGKK